MAERLVGTVSHYYGKVGVAGIDLSGALTVGDTIHVVGHTSDFTQTVDSMQIEHQEVEAGKPGDPVGIRVRDRARINDQVFLVTPD